MSKREIVFRALAEGPAFSEDIADATGVPVRNASAMLHKLWTLGRIVRSDERVPRNGKTSAYMYALRTRPWRAWSTRDVQALKEMAGEATPKEAARRLGRTVLSVRNQAKRSGVALVNAHVKRVWPVEVRMDAVRLRSLGKTNREISGQLGVPLSTVQLWSQNAH